MPSNSTPNRIRPEEIHYGVNNTKHCYTGIDLGDSENGCNEADITNICDGEVFNNDGLADAKRRVFTAHVCY